jgi:hypothetical protein
MPSNSTTAIKVNVDVETYPPLPDAGGFYGFSPNDGTVRFRKIPANVAAIGLRVLMPANPSDGDEYEFIDADGSCSPGNTIEVVAPTNSGTTFSAANLPGTPQPLPLFPFESANASARFQFDEGHNTWIVFQAANSIYNAQDNYASIGNSGAENPGNFAGGAAINLFAFLVKPSATGVFNLRMLLNMIVAGADAGVILAVSIIPNVTAFSGGTLAGLGNFPPAARFETGTGAGQPVVVTGDAPQPICEWVKQVGAAEIGHQTASLSVDINVPEPSNPLALGQVVLVTIADTAAAITGLALNAAIQEVSGAT